MKPFVVNLTFVLLLLYYCDAFLVTLYEQPNFKGARRDIDVTRCQNLFNVTFNDKTSSVIVPECTIVYEDRCCQGRSKRLLSSSDNLASLDFDNKVTSLSPCGDYLSPPPHQILESWSGHGQIMTKVAVGVDTVLYYSDDVQRTALQSHSQFIRKIWAHVKDTYGDFGPENSRLFAFFHAQVPTSVYGYNSLQSFFDVQGECRNLIDFVGKSSKAWSEPLNATEEDIDDVTHEIAHLVEWSSKGVHGSPSYHLWGDDVWPEIFTFDIYSALGLYQDRDRWFAKVQRSRHDYPRPNTFWFRDWFYPIYQQYGGAQVLDRYFEKLAQHFPRKHNDWEYERDMNLGEFVHFFSGAAKANLKPIAKKAFKWDDEAEREWRQAKREFPGVRY